ncbi:hypothetical protein BKG69_06035 [Mycobacteroides chelonae]|uniref:hypothetical protein n=1 Tax=Mycobacteroides chelonae TaxID=1774 RepID=UPI0008A89B75|nr:hypothetical protein [Mycobacteroides chelonae]OHT80467.1 hypothetical protein BKG69_06035 [Mycobacteroides chelonae]
MRDSSVRPGRRIEAKFGTGFAKGVIVGPRGRQFIEVSLDIDGADEPVTGLYRPDQIKLR